MKRIRKVDYYHPVAFPAVAPLAVDSFLREVFTKWVSLSAEGAAARLAERCMLAIPAGGLALPAGALDAVLDGPIGGAHLSRKKTDELMDIVRAALDALRPPAERHHRVLGIPQFWALGNALMPFTDVSLPFIVKVRRCSLCNCWIRVGEDLCPFCFIPSPGGKGKRAWVRAQIQLVQLQVGAGGHAPPPGAAAGCCWTNPAATGEEDDSEDPIDGDRDEEDSADDADPDEDDSDTEDEQEDGDEDPEEE